MQLSPLPPPKTQTKANWAYHISSSTKLFKEIKTLDSNNNRRAWLSELGSGLVLFLTEFIHLHQFMGQPEVINPLSLQSTEFGLEQQVRCQIPTVVNLNVVTLIVLLVDGKYLWWMNLEWPIFLGFHLALQKRYEVGR